MVPVQDPDAGTSLHELAAMEAPAEDPVGGGEEGDREGRESLQDAGPFWGREV
jgi:hypothetical protein